MLDGKVFLEEGWIFSDVWTIKRMNEKRYAGRGVLLSTKIPWK